MMLRPYQVDAVTSVLEQFRTGRRSTLLELPTGCGKTVVFAEIARRGVARGRRVLVLAHRTELLEQAAEKLAGAGVRAEIEQGARHATDAPVVIASVQTLRGARLDSWPADSFALVVIDEAHHAVATSYRAVLDHFTSARVLGVTATPDRGDGKALRDVFESVAFRYELRQAIRDGWLARIRARRIVVEGVDLGSVRTRAGDLDRGELATVMGDEAALHGVAVPLLELAGERRTIVFAVDVAHAHRLAEVLNRYVPSVACAADGSASAAVRAATLKEFRAGSFRVLVNCSLYTEGFDEPTIACVVVARPTKSRALYAQMIGRGTRLAPGKGDCLVLDFTGTAGRHRLVGPADALAGVTLADDLRDLANEMLMTGGEQLELDAVLEAADGDIAARREQVRVTAIARYRAEAIDPFLGDLPGASQSPWACEVATERQREALAKAGLEDLPEELTKGEASQWLDAIAARRSAGLATFKQVRFLRRYEVDARTMTLEDASAAIARIESRGWRKGFAA